MAVTVENPDPSAVDAYLAGLASARRRREAATLLDVFERVTGELPRLWGPSIIGFGRYDYRYESGHSGSAAAAGFSPRARAITIYLLDGVAAHDGDLAELGPHRAGVGCLYVTSLDAVDVAVLERIIRGSYATLNSETFPHRAAEANRRADPPARGLDQE